MNYRDYVALQPRMITPIGVNLAERARTVRLRGLGDSGDPGTTLSTSDTTGSSLPATGNPPQMQHVGGTTFAGGFSPFFWALSAVSTGLSAFHGYRRNNSVGWAVVWGAAGALFPVLTPAIAFAQGFGKRAGR